MKRSEPKAATFWISIGLAVLGLLAFQGPLAELANYAFGLVIAGFILLVLGNVLKGL